jgi:Holliday junction resolvasome RuvABC endonuclease subunit
MNKYLGIDISTKTFGWTVLNEKSELMEWGFHSFDNKKHTKTLLDLYVEIIDVISDIHNKHCITYVAIEEFMMMFAASKSSINTIIKLAQINTLCQLSILQTIDKPYLLNVSSARKSVVGTIPKTEKNKKKFIFDYFILNHPDMAKSLPKKIHKIKKTEVYCEEACDIVDSFIIAKSLVNIITTNPA